jgi:hypothetical protein
MKLWVVGQLLPEGGNAWSFIGCFSSEEKANSACDGPEYFVGPATLDQKENRPASPWLNAYLPGQGGLH